MPTPPNTAATQDDVRHALRGRLRSLRTALVVATLFAMALLWLIDNSFRQLTHLNTQRQDIEMVRSTVDGLTNNLIIAESSQRGFLLTGSEADLQLFDKARARIKDLQTQLEHKLQPQQGLQADDFIARLQDQLQQLQVAVDLYRNGRKEAAHMAASSVIGEQDMDAVREASAKLKSQAEAQLADKLVAFSRLVNYSRLAFLACVLTVLFGFLLYIQQRYRLREADLDRQLMLQTERDRLDQQVQVRTRELAALATHLQRAVERERARLARELHDELGALMTAAKFDVARMRGRLPEDATALHQRLAHLKDTLNDAIALKRRIMEDLYPSALHNLGLVPALDFLTREFAERSGLTLNADLQPVSLDEESQLTIYRLVQEALTNIAKHAHATTVDVTVREDADAVCVRVQDDGRGFDADHKPRGAHGLAGMRHRLHSCGGQLQIDARPGRGTHITARIPHEQAAPADH